MDNEQWIMIDVMLSETKHLKRFFATLRMTRGEFRMTKSNDNNNVIAPFRGLGVVNCKLINL